MKRQIRAGLALVVLAAAVAGCGNSDVRAGEQAMQQQDYDAAISHFRDALAAEPDDVQLRYQLVTAIVSKVNLERARGTMPLSGLEQSVREVNEIVAPILDQEPELKAALVDLHSSLARSYGEANMHEKARERWETIAKLAPSTTAYANAGHAATLLGDWEGAIKDFRKAVELDPYNATAYRGIGNAYIQLRQDQDAVEAYQKALEAEPLDYKTRYNLGVAYNRTNQPEQAIEEFQKVIEQDPTYPLAYMGMRNAYERMGEVEKALEWDTTWRQKAGLESREATEARKAEEPAAADVAGAASEAGAPAPPADVPDLSASEPAPDMSAPESASDMPAPESTPAPTSADAEAS